MNADAHCDRVLLAQADFDGELDPGQAAEMEAHRAGCPTCQAAYAELGEMRARLRQADLYRRAPDTLRDALAARLAGSEPPRPIPERRRSWRGPAAGFGFGAGLAAAIAVLVGWQAQPGIMDEVVASHVRALQPGHLEDVVSTDRHTVKPWFQGKLDFAPPVKDLAASGFPLTGARLDYLDGRPVAALVYARGRHPIDLFVWPASGGLAGPVVDRDRDGYHVLHWNQDGMAIWAVSDVDESQLRAFAETWRAMR